MTPPSLFGPMTLIQHFFLAFFPYLEINATLLHLPRFLRNLHSAEMSTWLRRISVSDIDSRLSSAACDVISHPGSELNKAGS